MEIFLLVGLVAAAALLVHAVMWNLRFDGHPPPPSPWILGAVLTVVVAILILTVAIRSWWNVATFALLTVTFGAMLLRALQARRSGL